MAVSATDKFMEVGNPGSATTLSAPGYTIGNTSITVASTTNWPSATGASFAIDRVDSSGVQIAGTYCEFVGTVASGTSITNVSKTFGTAQNYAAGATTRVYVPVSSTRENRLAQGMVVQHKQDGTHADVITTNAINENTTANGVTIDGLNIKDNKLNTNDAVIPSNLAAGTGSDWVFQTWTPTIGGFSANPTGGLYYYKQVGKKVTLFITMPNNGTSSTATITLTLPVTARTITNMEWNGFGVVVDNGVTQTTPGMLSVASGGTSLTVFLNLNAGGFTASGSKRLARGMIEYEAA
jgi:hypothetical protein